MCFLDMRNCTVAQSSRASPGRRYVACGSPWSTGFAACDHAVAHTHTRNLNPLHVKKTTIALPRPIRNGGTTAFGGVYFFPSCIILWSWCDERGLASYKFVEAENILPFTWRGELLTRALLLEFTTPRYCVHSNLCVCVYACVSVSGRHCIWKCLLPFSQQEVGDPSSPQPFFHSLTLVERLHFLPHSLVLGKISGFNFRVCVYIYVSVCVWGYESEKEGEIEVSCVQYKHLAYLELNLCLSVSLLGLSCAFKYSEGTLSYRLNRP